MKIILLAKFLRKDGASTHIYTLAREFDERGHEVHIISAGPTKDKNAMDLFNSSMVGNIKHHKVMFPCYAKFDFFSKIMQLGRYICVAPQVFYLMKKINPDIIHVHYPVTSYVAWLYCKLTNKKFVTTYHITGIQSQILHKKANAAIAISSELKKELKEKWEYEEENIHMVFNGVDKKRFSKIISNNEKTHIKSKLNIPNNKLIIGFVGTYEYKKGIDILIEACSKIDKEKFHIVLVGDGDRDYIVNCINKFNMQDNVSLHEFQDPVKFYSIFDIFVLPSRNEGFPLVALEAMMMETAVIRSDVSGAYDMINHKVDGYIFQNENIEDLKRDIEELIHDDKLRKRIAKRAREKALKNFSEEVMVENMLSKYEIIINN